MAGPIPLPDLKTTLTGISKAESQAGGSTIMPSTGSKVFNFKNESGNEILIYIALAGVAFLLYNQFK